MIGSLSVACSDDNDPSGLTASGGAHSDPTASGGVASSGGALGSGGQGSGGAELGGSSGGTTASGGADASGGSEASGGADGSGGAQASGGAGSGGDDGSGGSANEWSPCPAAGTPCAILPLGDSITEGYGSSGGGYRVELFRQANEGNHDITFVGTLQNGPNMVGNVIFPKNHQGHGGYTIDTDGGHSGISGSITQNALSMFHPHIVLLMIGTNDINGNVDVNNAPKRLGTLIDDITTRAPDTLLVVATIVPVNSSGTNQAVITYNNGVKDVVEARIDQGKHVQLLDNYAAIFEKANWQTALMKDKDILHPNDAGYEVLGGSFYDAIESYLP